MDTSSSQQWADAMLEQVSDTLRKTEILAGASVAPERTTQIVETEMRRLFQALLKFPRGIDKETYREALKAMQQSIEAVRALTYNETSDGNNDTLRFVRMREHEQKANAAFERLATLMQSRVPTRNESEVDGTFFLLDIASTIALRFSAATTRRCSTSPPTRFRRCRRVCATTMQRIVSIDRQRSRQLLSSL